MASSTAVGTAGVALLPLAFFLNLIKRLEPDDPWYLGLNLLGAGLACAASWMIGFVPFVVLEGAWFSVALLGMIRRLGLSA
ncbi:MAG TPA: hypothetical protein VNL14_07615 [Candidatus Acidoferrales bacterium]|nr:hypothetical protein [Candidatus Acidoferrales bacterium]